MKNTVLICGLGIFLFIVIAGCISPKTPINPNNNDLRLKNYCDIPSDCSKKDLIHPMCVGNWTCNENQCGWECDTQPEPLKDNPLTQDTCQTAGGLWNECGSACRGAPDRTPCTTECVQYCECGGIAGFSCPQGYKCTDFLPENVTDAMGICTIKDY